MAEEQKEKKGFFSRLVSGLSKTRANIVSSMDSIFNGFSPVSYTHLTLPTKLEV